MNRAGGLLPIRVKNYWDLVPSHDLQPLLTGWRDRLNFQVFLVACVRGDRFTVAAYQDIMAIRAMGRT